MFQMLRSDAHIQQPGSSTGNPITNVNSITVDAVSLIEKELPPHDLVSMVFLLYDAPDTALERLTVYERIFSDTGGRDLNLLQEWVQKVQTRSTWRHEFLEALSVCQQFKIVRRLGFQVALIKKHYQPLNIQESFYLNPMRKALYKLCENITLDSLNRLQNALRTYDHDTTEYKHCEVVILDLICKKFITVNNLNSERVSDQYFEVENLAKIIDNFPKLKRYADDLRQIEKRYHQKEPKISSTPVTSSTPTSKTVRDEPNKEGHGNYSASAFEDLYKYLNQLNIEETTVKNLKSDTKILVEGAYAINNPKRIGVCYIINQEDFHPSKESIEGSIAASLDKRHGSSKDKIVLERTMESLNFEVICHRNLNHIKMIEFIKNIIQYRVQHDDSIFMLCILSHGVRGHVFAADSVKVKIEDIQNLLDEGFQERQLYDIPKVMILQACQVNNDEPHPILVADAPARFYMRKSHFLIYWATAPELEAYRDEKKGSIFIQILCYIIQKYAHQEHLYDIFTKVTDGVARICTKLERDQIPIFESTLRKKLFLRIPE